MNHIDFNKLVEQELKRMKDVMCTKSADYSADDDKLFNFKLSAELDGISPIEALRGMWLKHRTSIRQGLDELMNGKCRPEAWWIEKLTDDRNYSILLQALLMEKYFTKFICPAGWTIRYNDGCGNNDCGWYVVSTNTNPDGLLHKDLKIYNSTGKEWYHGYGEAPGYWPTKEAAENALKEYLCGKTG